MIRNCDNCGHQYKADERNIKRGWGLCCSKSCAAKKREKSKPGYNSERVKFNNTRRITWNDNILDKRYGDKAFIDKIDDGIFRGRTTEGYRIYGNTAYDEWGEPIYSISEFDDTHPFDFDGKEY